MNKARRSSDFSTVTQEYRQKVDPKVLESIRICKESSLARFGAVGGDGGCTTWPPPQNKAEACHLAAD